MALSWPELTEGQWNLIASNVTSGIIDRLKSEFTYWATSVSTGAATPDASVKLKSPVIFQDSSQETISSSTAIDVYVWIENSNDDIDITAINAIQVTA